MTNYETDFYWNSSRRIHCMICEDNWEINEWDRFMPTWYITNHQRDMEICRLDNEGGYIGSRRNTETSTIVSLCYYWIPYLRTASCISREKGHCICWPLVSLDAVGFSLMFSLYLQRLLSIPISCPLVPYIDGQAVAMMVADYAHIESAQVPPHFHCMCHLEEYEKNEDWDWMDLSTHS